MIYIIYLRPGIDEYISEQCNHVQTTQQIAPSQEPPQEIAPVKIEREESELMESHVTKQQQEEIVQEELVNSEALVEAVQDGDQNEEIDTEVIIPSIAPEPLEEDLVVTNSALTFEKSVSQLHVSSAVQVNL